MPKKIEVLVELDERPTLPEHFEGDRTYATARNLGVEYYAQRLAEEGIKIRYPEPRARRGTGVRWG